MNENSNSRVFRRIAQLALIGALAMLFFGARTNLRSSNLTGLGGVQTAKPLLVGIDHIPVVVADLEKAQTDFRAMGFAIKPGRPHADGIQNAHVKFPDGTEIELITAPRAVDDLTTEYRDKLKSGEGPVYFGVYAPDTAALAARLDAIHAPVAYEGSNLLVFPITSPLHPLFFGQRNKVSTDRPEYFAHPNTAVRLSSLWVQDSPALRSVLKKLDISLKSARTCGPMAAAEGMLAGLPEGELYLVPSTTSILAARVEVQSLANAKAVLEKNGVPLSMDSRCDAGAVWVSPSNAHGIWLEFVETGLAAT